MYHQVRRHGYISRMLWVSGVTPLFVLLEAARPGAVSHCGGGPRLPVPPRSPLPRLWENHRRSGHALSRAPRPLITGRVRKDGWLWVGLCPEGPSRGSQGAGRRGLHVSCVPFTKSKQPSSNCQDWTRSLEGGEPHALSSEVRAHPPGLIGGGVIF